MTSFRAASEFGRNPSIPFCFFLLLGMVISLHLDAAPVPLLLRAPGPLGELRDVQAEWTGNVLKLSTSKAARHAWAVLPAPADGWDLKRRATVTAEIYNSGEAPVGVLFWVVGDRGWSAVQDSAALAPRETRTFSCDLRETYPDGTPKLDPGQIKQVQVMLAEPVSSKNKQHFSPLISKSVAIEIRSLAAQGDQTEWTRPPGRIDVPAVQDAPPTPGKRVRRRLPDENQNNIYYILHLPEDWMPGKKYPVIAELPGNIFYAPVCYSTGLPEQCVIGHGMTRGKGAICLGIPFLDRSAGKIAENGWGNPEDTADYVTRVLGEVCKRFGGDRENLVLTGFSRGAIACGFIGLRNERIASLWKGFHACQHYDGDGWNGASLPGALERAARFKGRSVFQTDNPQDKFQPVMDAMNTEVTWADSGLHFHSTAMFLDERPSTRRLRAWFWKLIGPSDF